MSVSLGTVDSHTEGKLLSPNCLQPAQEEGAKITYSANATTQPITLLEIDLARLLESVISRVFLMQSFTCCDQIINISHNL